MIRKIIKALWIFLAVIVLAIVIVFVSISKGWIGYMPPVEELENPSYKFATEIFSEDEKVLGTWSYSKENRVYTAYKDLSPSIINALIATEDVRFVEHSGIDAKALFRAFVKRGLMFQKNAGGGSTLSQQLAKQLFTENDKGKPLEIRTFENESEETTWLLKQIQKDLAEGCPHKEIAILFRTNHNCRMTVERLMEYNIPFTMRDVLPNLYEHWLAKNMVAYMRLAMGGRERKDFLAVMNRPNRYLSREAFYEKEVPFEILYQFYEGKEWMCDRIEKFEHDLKMMKNMAPFAAINYIRYGIGYDEFLKEYAQYRKIKVEELYDLLREIQESAKGYKTFQEWFDSMDAYKEKLKEQSEKVRRQEGIVVSTLHSAKGLEFERVYILDVNEGCMPYQKAVLDPEIEEERRMFYVGMTRAKKELHLYAVEERFGKKMEPSRFLVELEEAPKRGNGGQKNGK